MTNNILKVFCGCLIGCGVAAALTSCTDLDVTPESQYTKYPASDIAQEAQLADVYFHLRGTLGRRYMEAQSLASDEWVGISFDGDYYDSGTYAHTCLHNFSFTDPSIGWYDEVTAGITKANQAIYNMGGIEQSPEGTAPARAMRAFYTWILMDSYGDTPILDHLIAEDEAVVRQPRADVARWIEKELLDIIPLLSDKNDASTYGKPNKWMAEALLVKLYINWPVYTASDVTKYDAASYSNEHLQDVVKYCDEIIGSGLFDIAEGSNGYRSKFFPDNTERGIKDFIYVMPFDALTQQGFQYCRPRIWRQGRNDGNGGPGYFGSDIGNSTGGNFSMTPEMSDLMMALPKDDRQENILAGQIYMFNPETFAKTSTPYLYKGEPVVLTKTITLKRKDADGNIIDPVQTNTGKDVNGWSQGYKSVKWFVIASDFSNGRNQSNDLPIFRYADILLTKAEAITRGASATMGHTPQSLFNIIRTYANAPTLDHNPSLQELLDERGREFFDENWRRNDMIRFGTFESNYGFHTTQWLDPLDNTVKAFPTARFDKECRIFPIPEGTLNNNTNWKQNPGY